MTILEAIHMEIADALTCDFYRDGNWDRSETTRFHLYENGEYVGLDIETTVDRSGGSPEETIELTVDRLPEQTLKRIQDQLGEWLRDGRTESVDIETRPVDGTYRDTSHQRNIDRLRIEITRKKVRLAALDSGTPIANGASIPSTQIIKNNQVKQCNHLERFYSLLEIFLAGAEEASQDVIHSTRYLLNPDSHFDDALSDECLQRLTNGDHKGVVQGAGTALEERLQEIVPDSVSENVGGGSQLAERTFKKDSPACGWGYNSNEQQGLRYLYAGAFRALRNPMSHPRGDPSRERFLDDINRRDALDVLCFFNFLLRRLETYGTSTLEQEH